MFDIDSNMKTQGFLQYNVVLWFLTKYFTKMSVYTLFVLKISTSGICICKKWPIPSKYVKISNSASNSYDLHDLKKYII